MQIRKTEYKRDRPQDNANPRYSVFCMGGTSTQHLRIAALERGRGRSGTVCLRRTDAFRAPIMLGSRNVVRGARKGSAQ